MGKVKQLFMDQQEKNKKPKPNSIKVKPLYNTLEYEQEFDKSVTAPIVTDKIEESNIQFRLLL